MPCKKFHKLTKQFFIFLTLLQTFSVAAQTQTSQITSKSSVDWTKQEFSSQIMFDVQKANIPMPSGKNTAIDLITLELPKLIKDQLLSLAVDSSTDLSNATMNQTLRMEDLAQIMESGKRTPGFFTSDSSVLKTNHSMNLQLISALMVKHKIPYEVQEPIDSVPSRAYSGIIIDIRGELPVQGEFLKDDATPCFFPKIWDEKMNLIYERNMVEPEIAKEKSIVAYAYSEDSPNCIARVGKDPLRILARKVFGQNRTDPVITRKDALKILTVPENLKLLREGKVVFLMDKDNLVYDASTKLRSSRYYTALNTVQRLLYENQIPDITIEDTIRGILFQVDLKFYPDSPVLLPEENTRLSRVADLLKEILENDEFSILVEGHAASTGRPQGELDLSIERAKSVVEALEGFGIPSNLFSYKGYGSSQPLADNSTDSGRAQNRRVDITARPKATYIQREWK